MECSSIERLSDRRGLVSTGCLLGRLSQSPHGPLQPHHPVIDIHTGRAQARHRQFICLNQVWDKEAIDLHHLERGLPEATFYVFIFNLFSLFYSIKINLLIIYFALRKAQQRGRHKRRIRWPCHHKAYNIFEKKRLQYMNKFAVNMRQYIVYSSNTF